MTKQSHLAFYCEADLIGLYVSALRINYTGSRNLRCHYEVLDEADGDIGPFSNSPLADHHQTPRAFEAILRQDSEGEIGGEQTV